MANQSETGHAKNVANFNTLISVVGGYGGAYNPSKLSITPGALASMATTAQDITKQYNGILAQSKVAIAARKNAFQPLSKLSTRILNSLRACDTTEHIDRAVESLVHKIQGKRATPKKTEEEKAALQAEGTTVKEVSSSKMSFDNRLDSFDQLIQLLSSVQQYAPNEEDLKLPTLINYYNGLKTVHSTAVSTETQLNNVRFLRNEMLYKPDGGLVDTAFAVKAYVKSVFGASSSQYKQIAGLAFKTDRSFVATTSSIAPPVAETTR